MALTIGPDHLGTSEALWRCSGWIDGLPEWGVPSAASAEDGPILPAPNLQRFRRDHEVVWV
jgi:hypothetical protein